MTPDFHQDFVALNSASYIELGESLEQGKEVDQHPSWGASVGSSKTPFHFKEFPDEEAF